MNLDSPSIALIGPGVMAEAIIAGLLRKHVTPPEQIRASGPHLDRVTQLQARYNITPYTDNRKAAEGADVIILSIKPQRLERVLAGLNGSVRPEALVLSIVAGATIQQISAGLGHESIARAMPNTPAQIGEGITVWTVSESVSEDQRQLAGRILGALGEEVFVEEENYLDMATALSGTGPAYVFLFMEAMIDAGVHLGFPRRIAERLVTETLRGSVDYYEEKKVHIARLRNEVTSPGGTSAAALYYLEKAGFRTAISRAVWAAFERSLELGKGKSTRSPENPEA
ncbi:MAG TPA: pyrroline-5-carboxylate reductase [Chloroflexi bacterium]|nr:pyrroline-5-carboxylate reductase [Chloroflexota bacterium]HPO58710.1 pyrroline-5-carboxylate reductase [Anaerolineaceae bacterium]